MAATPLTTKEKTSGVFVVIASTAIMGGMLFLMSWLAHQHHPEEKSPAKPAAHGGKGAKPAAPAHAAAAKKEAYPPSEPQFWIWAIPTLGLSLLPPVVALVVGLVVGFLYGLVAALVAAYDLSKIGPCFALILDLTWSLSNTLLGFVVIHQIYLIFFGTPDRGMSRGATWISFSGSVGGKVLQTWGTVNVGGKGAHEDRHLLQVRILGPIFIPFHAANYVVLGVIQIVFTILIGWWTHLLGWRDSAWFRPDAKSVVKSPPGKSGPADFFGWIYRYTLMEIWGYW